MTAALLCGAAALLSWPASRATGRLAAAGRSAWLHRLGAAAPSPVVVALTVTALGAVLSTPLVAVLAGGCTLQVARGLRSRRAAARMEARLLAVAEALGVLAAELTAGRDPGSAVTTAVATCPDPEAARALAATVRDDATGSVPGDGGPVGTALGRLQGAVRLSARTGCPLGAVTAALADDLRARHRAGLELRSATAGPRASAAVLAGLPLLGLAMGSGIGADPWHVLTTTAAGQVLLTAGVLLEAAGVAWTGRLLRSAADDGVPPATSRGT
jgi:tight adherence protein B